MIDITNIQKALIELIEGTIGATRTLTANTLDQAPTSAWKDAAIIKTSYDISFGDMPNNKANPFHVRGNYRLVDVPITILIKKPLSSPVNIADRDTARAGLIYVADQVAQAISFPGNLTQTSGALATNLISGCFQQVSIGKPVEDWDKQLISCELTATAIARVSQAV